MYRDIENNLETLWSMESISFECILISLHFTKVKVDEHFLYKLKHVVTNACKLVCIVLIIHLQSHRDVFDYITTHGQSLVKVNQ